MGRLDVIHLIAVVENDRIWIFPIVLAVGYFVIQLIDGEHLTRAGERAVGLWLLLSLYGYFVG